MQVRLIRIEVFGDKVLSEGISLQEILDDRDGGPSGLVKSSIL